MQLEFLGDRFERPPPPEADLPEPPVDGRLRELWAALGYEGLMRLLDHYGGVSVYIPHRIAESHPLAQALGLDTAQALRRLVRNGHFPVPTGRNLRSALRNLEIRALRAQGASVRTLARRFRMSERWICAVLAREDRA